MKYIAFALLILVLVGGACKKTPTGPAVTNADIELFDEFVNASGNDVSWQGRVLNRSNFTVNAGVKLVLVTGADSTFYTFSEKLVEVPPLTSVPFTYYEGAIAPSLTLPTTWNWRMTARLVQFK